MTQESILIITQLTIPIAVGIEIAVGLIVIHYLDQRYKEIVEPKKTLYERMLEQVHLDLKQTEVKYNQERVKQLQILNDSRLSKMAGKTK